MRTVVVGTGGRPGSASWSKTSGAQFEVVGFLSDLKRGEEVGFRSVGIAQLLQGVACVTIRTQGCSGQRARLAST